MFIMKAVCLMTKVAPPLPRGLRTHPKGEDVAQCRRRSARRDPHQDTINIDRVESDAGVAIEDAVPKY